MKVSLPIDIIAWLCYTNHNRGDKLLLMNSCEYLATIERVKREISSAQYRAATHKNANLILLYHK